MTTTIALVRLLHTLFLLPHLADSPSTREHMTIFSPLFVVFRHIVSLILIEQ